MQIINLHIVRQTFDYDCGAKALQVVMAYYGLDIREDKLLKELGTGPEGTRVERMIAAARRRGFDVEAHDRWQLRDLKARLDAGHPAIVLLQAWADRYMTLKDWQQDNHDGHYAVLIGYSKQVLLFEDPSSFRRTWLRITEFMARWHDYDSAAGRQYERFAMLLRGRPPARQAPVHMG